MEKRYITFIIMSLILVISHQLIMATFFPPPEPKPEEQVAAGDEEPKDGEPADGDPEDGDPENGDADTEPTKDPGETATGDAPAVTGDNAEATAEAEKKVPLEWAVLGNYQTTKHVVYLTNRGAAVRCVELVERLKSGRLRYRDLVNKSGYLGYLGLVASRSGGCRIQVVAPGTPAADAGLVAGDIIRKIGETEVDEPYLVTETLSATRPGDEVELTVSTTSGDKTLSVQLAERPLALIHNEIDLDGESLGHPASFLMSLNSIGVDRGPKANVKQGQMEIQGLRSTRSNNWVMNANETEVTFTWRYGENDLKKVKVDGELEIIKRFALPTELGPNQYHLDFNLELKNVGATPLNVSYRLDGPNGLPTEGWWYLYKVHPSWGTGGARDITWRTDGVGYELRSASQIWKQEKNNKKSPVEPAFVQSEQVSRRTVYYAGVDTQYFHAALLPVDSDGAFAAREYAQLTPYLLNDAKTLDKNHVRLGNVSYHLTSEIQALNPNESYDSKHAVFLGPKRSEVLSVYGLDETIVWGWFWWVAWPLSSLLHFFYMMVRNYGLAILMLTILVRACVHPISRKAHGNAQMMQALAPETKKITEKYKDDPQKRMEAQQELYKKYNFNPLSGCLLAFAQFPIFIGLYRCLSVDIELRDAALIPGVNWCTNLAGPDMMFAWGPKALPFLTDYTGWLGPYFNILPLISVVLFIIQQQMFTPPPTDEQQAMQQKMMKGMTLFIGVLFYKVAAGLCLYIIISSLWGVLERQFMPKQDLEKLREKKAQQAIEKEKDKPKRTADDVKKAENVVNRKKKKNKAR